MRARSKLTGLLMAGVLYLPVAAQADTPQTHRAHKVKKQQPLPPPLPSGSQGPVPQIPLDAIPAVAPQVTYQNGMLTIVAPNSSLGDILRGVRKQTEAEIEIPTTASERVVTRLGPGPAREVVAQLLNGSHFNYVLLGSPDNSKLLVRVVLVAKTGPDNPTPTAQAANNGAPAPANAITDASEAEVAEEPADDTPPDQPTVEAEQQQTPVPPEQQGVKTPQQMLQEMQQRQLQMQQQQGQQNGQQPIYPPPNGMPQRPQPPPQEQQ